MKLATEKFNVMKFPISIIVLLLSFQLGVDSYGTFAEAKQASTSSLLPASALWREGDSWTLGVDFYPQGDPSTVNPGQAPPVVAPVLHYLMQVEVGKVQQVNQVECWPVDFIPGKDAPANIREQAYRVLISRKDGTLRLVLSLRGTQDAPALIPLKDFTTILSPPQGFPLEFLPVSRSAFASKSPDELLALAGTLKRVGQQQVVTAQWKIKNEEGPFIQQTWVSGAKWWSGYERKYKGQTQIRARLISTINIWGPESQGF